MAFIPHIISPNSNLLLIQEIGLSTGEHLLKCHREVLREPTLGQNLRILVTLTDIDSKDLDAQTMAGCIPLQKQILEKRDVCRVAVHAPSPLAYGMARMFKAYVETTGHFYGVFSHMEEALAWLSVTIEEQKHLRKRLLKAVKAEPKPGSNTSNT